MSEIESDRLLEKRYNDRKPRTSRVIRSLAAARLRCEDRQRGSRQAQHADFHLTFSGQDAPVSMSFASLLCCGTHQLGRTTVISRGPTGSFVLVANHDESMLPVDLVLATPARRWRNTGYRRALYPPLPIAPTNGAGSSIEQKYTVDLPKFALIVELTGIAGEIGRLPAEPPCDRPPNPLAGKSRRTRQKAAECGHQYTTYQHLRFHIALLRIKLSTDRFGTFKAFGRDRRFGGRSPFPCSVSIADTSASGVRIAS